MVSAPPSPAAPPAAPPPAPDPSLPPDGKAAAKQVAQQAVKQAEQAREWVDTKWKEFRAESVYFQAKVGLIAAYAAVVLLTFVVVRAGTRPEPWKVEQRRISLGLSFVVTIDVTNVDAGDVKDAIVEVDGRAIEFDGKKSPGTWKTAPMELPEDNKVSITPAQLFDKRKNTNPPPSLVIDTVRIMTIDGDVLAELNPPPPDASVKD